MVEPPPKPGAPERRLAAILAADVAGYSRLMGQDEAATVREIRGHQSEILPMIATFGGNVVDTAGDGILAAFPSVVRAVECAIAIQQTMDGRNRDIPEDRRMGFRIGVNLGDMIQEGARIYGDGVNLAARLEGLAEPGGIRVSAKVCEEIRGRIAVDLDDMGEQALKNIDRPVRTYRLRRASIRRRR